MRDVPPPPRPLALWRRELAPACMSQAGGQIELSEMGRWWAAVPRSTWPAAHVGSIEADYEGEWGDRRQELVFIGSHLPRARIVAALDACLATDEEMSALSAAKAVN